MVKQLVVSAAVAEGDAEFGMGPHAVVSDVPAPAIVGFTFSAGTEIVPVASGWATASGSFGLASAATGMASPAAISIPKFHARMYALTGASLHQPLHPLQHGPGLSGGQHGDHLGRKPAQLLMGTLRQLFSG